MTTKNSIKPISPFKRIFEYALLEAKRSTDPRKQVGCIITDANMEIVSTGFNGRPVKDHKCHEYLDPNTNKSHPALLHAEERALLRAGTKACNGGYIFVTHCPCLKCASRILEAGISKVFYLEDHDEGVGSKYLTLHDVSVTQVTNIRRSIDKRVQAYDETGLSAYDHEIDFEDDDDDLPLI